MKGNAGFVFFFDKVVVECLFIVGDQTIVFFFAHSIALLDCFPLLCPASVDGSDSMVRDVNSSIE